jgi:hypothetical protein
MDEMTFQHQLRELKQRVSNMAEVSSSWLPSRPHSHPALAPGAAPNYHQDLYSAQLLDVKHKLDRMQANLPTHWQAQILHAGTPLPATVDGLEYVRSDLQKLNETIERNNALGKESLESLRLGFADLHDGMRKGFDNLEQAVSELKRNTAFTPASSEATDEDLTAAHAGFPSDTTPAPYYGPPGFGTASHPGFIHEPRFTYEPGLAKYQSHNSNDSPISPSPGFYQGLGPPLGGSDCYVDPNRSVHPDYRARHDVAVWRSDGDGLVGGKEDGAVPQANWLGIPTLARDQTVEGASSAFPQGRQVTFEGLTQLLGLTCPRPAVLPEPFIKYDLGNFRDSLVNRGDTGTTAQASHEYSDIKKDESRSEDAWGPLDMNSPDQAQLKIEQTTNQQLRDTIAAKDEEIAELEVGQVADRREKDAIITHLNDCKSAAEEAFEITRSDLEKRLDEAKDRHDDVKRRHGESLSEIHRLKQSAESAQRDFEVTERTRWELQGVTDREIERLRHELQQCEASRHHFMTKYVDENYRFRWLEQRKSQSEQYYQQQLHDCEGALEISERNRDADISSALQSKDELQHQLEECEGALETSQRNREAYIRGALRSRDGDLDRLHVFCKEKDAVIYRQEQIIAQGASILEERDAEIDRLSAALDESKRSEQDAREHAAKNKRTIQKRDAQVEHLHREVKEERERRCRPEDLMRRDAEAMRTKAKDVRFSADEQDSGRSFANAADVPAYAVSRGQSGRRNPLWTPQPIQSSARLPHEEDRASFWEDGDGDHATTKTKHVFGSSSPIVVQQRRKPGRGRSNEKRASREHDDNRRSFASNDNVTEEESRGQHRQRTAMYSNPSRHQSEALASNREALQLLAGWTERTLQEQGQPKNSQLHEQASQSYHAHLQQQIQLTRQQQRQQASQSNHQQFDPAQLPAHLQQSLQLRQQNQQRPMQQQRQQPPQLTQQTHADMSHQIPGAGSSGGDGGGGRRSPSSRRMKAQAPTNGGTAENGRHALPLDDTTWLPAPAHPAAAAVERVGSVPDLRAGRRRSMSRSHASSREHSAMSKPASMFDPRPQKGHMASQTYRAPSVETEAESSSADERTA